MPNENKKSNKKVTKNILRFVRIILVVAITFIIIKRLKKFQND